MGGRDGLLATQMISLSSLSFSFSRCVCAYISEREKTTTKGDREREIDARKQFFIWTFAPRTLSLSPKKEGPVKMHKNRRPMSE